MIKCWEFIDCNKKDCIARTTEVHCWNIKLRCDHIKMFCFSENGCTNCNYFKLMNKMESTIEILKDMLGKK
jgi:hypothetical protein